MSPGYFYRAAVTAALMRIRRRRANRQSGVEMTPHLIGSCVRWSRPRTAMVRLPGGGRAGARVRRLGRSALRARTLAANRRPVWNEYMGIFDRAYDPVRRSPRFIALVRQTNLDIKAV